MSDAAAFLDRLADRLDTDDWEGVTDEQWWYIRERAMPMIAEHFRAAERMAEALDIESLRLYHNLSFADSPSYHDNVERLDECGMCVQRFLDRAPQALAAYRALTAAPPDAPAPPAADPGDTPPAPPAGSPSVRPRARPRGRQ